MAEWEAGIDRAIAKRRFTASFMSDSKWRRLLTALLQPEVGISQVLWKFVDLEKPIRFAFPDADSINNGLVSEPGGESPFKRIEWMEIPEINVPYGWEKIPQKHRLQNMEAAMASITDAGQFEVERTTLGLRIYGYR
jgi:hypothetical protein